MITVVTPPGGASRSMRSTRYGILFTIANCRGRTRRISATLRYICGPSLRLSPGLQHKGLRFGEAESTAGGHNRETAGYSVVVIVRAPGIFICASEI